MSKDPYKVLGISKEADDREIRGAYRSLAKRYHPDAGTGSSEERFREIQDAYDTLSDPDQRAAHARNAESTTRPAGTTYGEYSRRQGSGHIDLRNYTGRKTAEARIYYRDPIEDDLDELMLFLHRWVTHRFD
jgi:curved DNA-binding protein CbpA